MKKLHDCKLNLFFLLDFFSITQSLNFCRVHIEVDQDTVYIYSFFFLIKKSYYYLTFVDITNFPNENTNQMLQIQYYNNKKILI